MASMKLPNFQEPRTPIPLSIYVQHFFPPRWPWKSGFKQTPHHPLQQTKSKQKQNQVTSH